ncbi:hypothetical protein [Microbulbifer pacificus]|uniref:Lipoprotein n=1 Tax=Microbulbifer pacificus TaxID=407164 RepID=A0AAU0MVQ0_9GAMM|nr:hypothetical protein [Microbulbifer pacificus]WOX04259.1 hypothetical protein R5R33_10945 [Microbulbifer pacificus]
MRKLTATALVILMALAAVACDRDVCYRDGERERKPSIPFASISSDFAPVLALAQPF